MKKYAAFSYDNYYPSGGWGDFLGFVDSLEEAIRMNQAREYGPLDNVDIVCTEKWEWVESVLNQRRART